MDIIRIIESKSEKHPIEATVSILKLKYKLNETIGSYSCANVNSNCGADWDMLRASDSTKQCIRMGY